MASRVMLSAVMVGSLGLWAGIADFPGAPQKAGKPCISTVVSKAAPHTPATPTTLPGVSNFAKISDALYRGEQPTERGFAELKKLGVKTIVNLRMFHGDSDKMRGLGMKYYHIHAAAWDPGDDDMIPFLKIVRDPANQPVFVHCQHGADRTGTAVAAYRIVEQHWTIEEALAELPIFGHHTIFTGVKSYLKAFDCETMKERIDAAPAPVLRFVE